MTPEERARFCASLFLDPAKVSSEKRARVEREIAVSIRSDYKGKGVGWALLDFLAEEARTRGVRRVIAIESRDNHAAIELEREKGFTPEPFDDDPTLVVLSKTLRA